MIYAFFADGFEEIEAVTPVDVLRRAGLQVTMVSVTDSKVVRGAHDISVVTDILFEETDYEDAILLILPGGMPGVTHLDCHEGLIQLIDRHVKCHLPIAAICAAPMVLGSRGLLDGYKATCYPGCETSLGNADYTAASVEEDGIFITGKGAGTAMEFAFAILKRLRGEQVADELQSRMMVSKG